MLSSGPQIRAVTLSKSLCSGGDRYESKSYRNEFTIKSTVSAVL